jgi:CRP/FNR family cyclic AMP-dependent transcriptional regulator
MAAGLELEADRLIQVYRSSWPATSFLAGLSQEPLKALMTGRRATLFSVGQHLMAEGDRSSDVFLLISASVKITVQLNPGTALLAVRIGGDVVGEMGATDGDVRSATVTAARDDTIAVMIPAGRFTSVIDRYPPAARLLASTLARKLRASDRRRVDFTAYQVSVRVARVLAEMAEEYGQRIERRPAMRILRMGLSQGELATLIGAKEASVGTALGSLRSRGILRWEYRSVTIEDIEALRAAGQLPSSDGPPRKIP